MTDGAMGRLPDNMRTVGHSDATTHDATAPTSTAGTEHVGNIDGAAPWRRAVSRILGAILTGVTRTGRHWLLVMNVLFGVIVVGAILDPILFLLGQSGIASRIFALYHYICEQIPSHSYFLSGYQLALCARNLALYSSLFVGTLIYRLVRDRLPILGWRLWLLTVIPIALDGFTQLFGLRESNWELRTLTGVLFGLGICWLLLPQIEEAARGEDFPTHQGKRPRIELNFGLISGLRSIFRRVFTGHPEQPQRVSV